jgi:ABC-type oligopeptide transport system substrate-binding subunit
MDAILNGMTQLSSEEAMPYFKEAQRIIVDEGYWVPLYYSTNYKIAHKTVVGLEHPQQSGGWIYLKVEITD